MVLNNKPQMFTIFFPSNFFYDEVKRKWEPIIQKMKLPYQSLDDFMNSQIQSLEFPAINMMTSTQGRWQYEVTYASGQEREALIGNDISITFKLTESYLSYFIWWDQIDAYLHYYDPEDTDGVIDEKKPCWMEPVHLAFLSDQGFQLSQFTFLEITPTNLSSLNLSYAATAASYNTFSVGLHFNRFSIEP